MAVVLVAAVATVLKLEVAARTEGTNDVHYFGAFAQGVRHFGPVGIYGHTFSVPVYNHGPLVGWLLLAINWLLDRGVTSFPFLIRVPACLADLVTAVLVFELVRLARPTREAATAGVLVACSPVLFVVSGFHGNTDPVFLMFALLSAYLLAVRDRPFAAGLAFAVAVSIKLVPFVLVPVLLVMLLRLGRRRLVAFGVGGAIVFCLLWVPVLVSRPGAFRAQVLAYTGLGYRQWGLVQFLTWAHLPGLGAWLVSPGRFLLVLASGLGAAAVAWRRPDRAVQAVGLSFVLFLLLSPAFGMQYLTWAVAAAYLIDTRVATAYNAVASVFVVVVYDHWNDAPPWHWHDAWALPFTSAQLGLMIATWVVLAVVGIAGLRLARRDTESDRDLLSSDARAATAGHALAR